MSLNAPIPEFLLESPLIDKSTATDLDESTESATKTVHLQLPHEGQIVWRTWGDDGRRRNLRTALWEGWQDLLASGALARQLFRRDFAAKYRESYLGYAWAFLPSIILAVSMTLASQAAILNTDGVSIPYAALVLIGMCLWQTFSEALLGPIQAVNQSKPLLARIKFPVEAILLAKLGEIAFNAALRMLLIAAAMLLYQVPVASTVPLAIFGLAALILLGTAFGVLLAPIGGLYNDVLQGITLVLGLWMFLTPVVYEQAATGSMIGRLNLLNPVSPLLVSTREWLIGQPWSNPVGFAVVTTGSLFLLVAGWLFFRFAMSFAVERAGA